MHIIWLYRPFSVAFIELESLFVLILLILNSFIQHYLLNNNPSSRRSMSIWAMNAYHCCSTSIEHRAKSQRKYGTTMFYSIIPIIGRIEIKSVFTILTPRDTQKIFPKIDSPKMASLPSFFFYWKLIFFSSNSHGIMGKTRLKCWIFLVKNEVQFDVNFSRIKTIPPLGFQWNE